MHNYICDMCTVDSITRESTNVKCKVTNWKGEEKEKKMCLPPQYC